MMNAGNIVCSTTFCLLVISKAHCQWFSAADLNDPLAFEEKFVARLKYGQMESRQILERLNGKTLLLFSNPTSSGNESECQRSFTKLKDDYKRKERYALRVADSWGKIGSGIELGNRQWMGRYYECLDIQTSQFSGKYFSVTLDIKSRFTLGHGIVVGVCLPNSCSTNQSETIIEQLFNTTAFTLYSPHQPSNYTSLDIATIVIICLLGCLLIVATVYELYLKNLPSINNCDLMEPTRAGRLSGKALFSSILLSFSVKKNTDALLDTSRKEGNINVLHGLRFFSMSWIILAHTFAYAANYIDNGIDAARYFITHWSFEVIGNGGYSVDTFFFLSGLLGAFVGLKEMRRRDGKIYVFVMYGYRYLRLTTPYALCVLIMASLYGKFGDGPFWSNVSKSYRDGCQAYWWTNLLYINNMYPWNLNIGCFGWGWYLANDMQFFLFLPILLYLMRRRPLVGAIVTNIFVLLSMIANGVISYHYKKQPSAFGRGMSSYTAVHTTSLTEHNLDQNLEPNATFLFSQTSLRDGHKPSGWFWSDLYTKPWSRMGPYFVGVFTGLVMHTFNRTVTMKKVLIPLGWMMTCATGLALVYGLFGHIAKGHNFDLHVAAFYNATCRPVWGYCLMWIVIACEAGYGGPITHLLSWKALIPLSRLTYCAYLVHPMILIWMYGIMETTFHFGVPLLSILYGGVLLLSYGVAFVLSVSIEMPMIGVTKILFGKVHQPQSLDLHRQYDRAECDETNPYSDTSREDQ